MASTQSKEKYGYEKLPIKYGIQTIFSTIPFQSIKDEIKGEDNNNKTSFERDIEQFYFKKFRKNLKFSDGDTNFDLLYKPLKFFMLGDYDVLYITLINNFKFSHRLFEPIAHSSDDDIVYNAHTFQSYSGFVLNQNEEQIRRIYQSAIANNDNEDPVSYFIGVINLKLNNGLFIGNGLKFSEKVYEIIDCKLKELNIENYLINQTFSWFELSLMIFIDDPEKLKETLQHLRAMVLGDLNDSGIEKNSLYLILDNKEELTGAIKRTSIFADTNSHLGFNERLIRKSFKTAKGKSFDTHVQKFYEEAKKLNLKTEIEWQVKPGHILDLIELIKNNDYLKEFFFSENKNNFTKSETNIVLGKCDYYISEISENNSNSILSNFHLIRHIARDKTIFNHIRKVRTYIFLDNLEHLENEYKKRSESTKDKGYENKKLIKWAPILEKLAIKNKEFHKYDTYLKKLKVSRHIRNKILKVFSNFNNGILDPIQFTYFLDISILIEKLKLFIKHEADNAYDEETKSVAEISEKLLIFINTFQEAYYVRFLNGYQFENISDFDLDYNNSIQQLLSSYGILVHHYGKLFYEEGSLYAPVIQLNDLDTVSDLYSINYAIHHFTSPEFVFTTLAKEVLNSLLQEEEFLKIKDTYNYLIFKIKEGINESYFDDLIESETFDLNYFIIDVIRYHTTFNRNFELFQHWIWSYNFQNTSLYDTDGMFNENHLKTEMLRLLMLQKYVRSKAELLTRLEDILFKPLQCPTSHIEAYWFLHIEKLDNITSIIFKQYDKEFTKIFEYINKKIANFQEKKISEFHLKNLNTEIIEKTLMHHYKLNNNKVVMVNRNWNNGEFCENNYDPKVSYAIDQIGTQFFYTNKATQTYFEFNAQIILSVIDYATKHKKDFISYLISTKE